MNSKKRQCQAGACGAPAAVKVQAFHAKPEDGSAGCATVERWLCERHQASLTLDAALVIANLNGAPCNRCGEVVTNLREAFVIAHKVVRAS